MKNLLFSICAFISLFTVTAQNQTSLIANVSISEKAFVPEVVTISPETELMDYSLLAGGCGIITTICFMSESEYLNRTLPFKVYCIENTDFNIQQDIYNAIRANVPGIQISNTDLTQTPKITMRGDSNTIVIVDGIRVDTSMLNNLNPADIESIKVVNGVAATNYFLSRQW